VHVQTDRRVIVLDDRHARVFIQYQLLHSHVFYPPHTRAHQRPFTNELSTDCFSSTDVRAFNYKCEPAACAHTFGVAFASANTCNRCRHASCASDRLPDVCGQLFDDAFGRVTGAATLLLTNA
jgi:hypothetical protein